MLAMLVVLLVSACGSSTDPADSPRGSSGGVVGLSNGVCLDGTNGANPNVITVGLACTGSIGAFADIEFQFTATASTTYTIALTGIQSDLSWELSVDRSFRNFVCDRFRDSTSEICSTSEQPGYGLTAGEVYYLLVSEWDNVAGSFALQVQPD